MDARFSLVRDLFVWIFFSCSATSSSLIKFPTNPCQEFLFLFFYLTCHSAVFIWCLWIFMYKVVRYWVFLISKILLNVNTLLVNWLLFILFLPFKHTMFRELINRHITFRCFSLSFFYNRLPNLRRFYYVKVIRVDRQYWSYLTHTKWLIHLSRVLMWK